MNIPPDLLQVAEKHGIGEKAFLEMVKRSARYSHPLGNRRYKDFLFLVEGNEVRNVYRLASVAVPLMPTAARAACWFCDDLLRIALFDECATCEGDGCALCDKGLVRRLAPCPYCAIDKKS